MSVLDILRPHKKEKEAGKPAEEAPVDTSVETTPTLETEATPTPQSAELGTAAVATLVAPAETAPEAAPEASTDQPSDADALATVEGAVNEQGNADTFTVPATSQNIEPAPLSSQSIENAPATDQVVEQSPNVTADQPEAEKVNESPEVVAYGANAPEANISTLSDAEVREGFGLTDSTDSVVAEASPEAAQPEEEDTVIANKASIDTIAGAEIDSLGHNQ